MKQIAVISGKGGTGKTVITASFAALAKNKVMVDSDVDAADLHLLLHPDIRERHEFQGGATAKINPALCQKCRQCIDLCRFKAITEDFEVDSIACEGCALCYHVCPSSAIGMEVNTVGEWYISDTRYGPFVHAKLGIAQENSGKLVAQIRQVAKEIAEKNRMDLIIIDGPPGIGCPVMASLTGVDDAVIVTEPTLSGIHDAERVMKVARYFGIRLSLVINKYDLNISITEQIETFGHQQGVPVIGKIAFDKVVVESIVNGKTIVEYTENPIKKEIIRIWEQVK